jgi:iron(III) transport system ATP-binding protein
MAFIEIKNISKQFAGAVAYAVRDFSLEINCGEIISLLGPSGSGKTTTLRMLAGFESPDKGTIAIAGSVLNAPFHSVPPEKRGIGMVFQDYALFPHLNIEKNVAFGIQHLARKERNARVEEVLQLVGLSEYKTRMPNELSGGQQQRVALARALAPAPNVVLLDEPFSNLDTALKERMRNEISAILRKANVAALIVTHDQQDAFAISDRVVVMNQGVIQQIDEPKAMYRCPSNCFVAQFIGKTNLVQGRLASDQKHVFTHIGKVCLPQATQELMDQVTLSIRPEGCRLVDEGKYCGEVQQVVYNGSNQEVTLRMRAEDGNYMNMLVYAPIENDVKPGQIVSFNIAPELVAVLAD